MSDAHAVRRRVLVGRIEGDHGEHGEVGASLGPVQVGALEQLGARAVLGAQVGQEAGASGARHVVGDDGPYARAHLGDRLLALSCRSGSTDRQVERLERLEELRVVEARRVHRCEVDQPSTSTRADEAALDVEDGLDVGDRPGRSRRGS